MAESTSVPANNSAGKTPRRRAREFALQGVYEHLLSAHSASMIENHLVQVSGFEKADKVFFGLLLRGTLDQIEALEAQFVSLLDRPVAELSPIERAVLLLATFELQNQPETPYRVIINEAIELTKGYGGSDGHRFVNGVLDKLALRIREAEIRATKKA